MSSDSNELYKEYRKKYPDKGFFEIAKLIDEDEIAGRVKGQYPEETSNAYKKFIAYLTEYYPEQTLLLLMESQIERTKETEDEFYTHLGVKDRQDYFKKVIDKFGRDNFLTFPPSNILNFPEFKTLKQLFGLIQNEIDRGKITGINIIHHITGKPKRTEIKEVMLNEIKELFYQCGELKTELPKNKFSEIGQASIVKFMDYCILNMNQTGAVPALNNLSDICRDFNLVIGGKNTNRLNSIIDYLCNTKVKISINYKQYKYIGNEYNLFLSREIIEYPTIGGKTKTVIVGYRLPAFLIELKNSYQFKIFRDHDIFKISDTAYEIMISIHGWLRMNLERNEHVVNLKIFLRDYTSRPISKNVGRALEMIHADIDELIAHKQLKEWFITDKKTGARIDKNWYENKEIKLTHTNKGETKPNFDYFETLYYHFRATDKFINDHRYILGYKQEQLALGGV